MPSPEQQNSLEQQLQQYQANLAGAASYLERRGVTLQFAEKFRLGFDVSKQRLVIPYLNPVGLWHFKYRCVIDHDCQEVHGSKYFYEVGSTQHLFNAQTLLDARYAILCEGELDAITAEQCGVAAVGYPGVSTWAANRHWCFCFESLDELVVVADGDEAGRKAAGQVAASLRDVIAADVKVIDLGDGQDVNSFVLKRGESVFLDRIGWLQ